MSARILLPNVDAAEPSVSNHELRRFLAGELTPERRAQIESDPALAPRLEKLAAEARADDAAFQHEMPLPRFLADHEMRTAPTGFFARIASIRFTLGAGALVATAAAVFLVVGPPGGGDEGNQLKGDARVGFMVRENEGAHFGVDGEELTSGAQIQFAVRDPRPVSMEERASMVLVGIDGRGVVTVYAAERVDGERVKGAPAQQEKTRLLGQSVVLDDSTGPERFFVVYANADVRELEREVEAAARKLAGASLASVEELSLPSGYTQSSVHIVKVPPG